MKTIITITGIGKRKSGVSAKTGKSYDFTPVSFLYDSPFYTGQKAATVIVDTSALGDCDLVIGSSVPAVLHEDFRTDKVYLDAIL